MKTFTLVILSAFFVVSCSVEHLSKPEISTAPAPQNVVPKAVTNIPVASTPKVSAAPTRTERSVSQVVKAVPQVPRPSSAIKERQATLPAHPLEYTEVSAEGVTFSLVLFDQRAHQLTLADQKALGGQWSSAQVASKDLGGVAAINGGFFTASGDPLGLVRSGGAQTGAWNGSSSLASGVYQSSGGRTSLKRNAVADRQADHLLQTGPFLVERGALVSGLSEKRRALRSVLLWDGDHHFGFGVTSACTLGELARAVHALPNSVPHKTALNLDGGRSSDLYVGPMVKNGGKVKGHWLKSQVRNYLVLKGK